MVNEDNLFYRMFKHAERISLEEFTDQDLKDEGIEELVIPDDDIVLEGLVTAVVGEIGREYSSAYREIKGWFQGIESKKRQINEGCLDLIAWLKEEDQEHPRLSLEMGNFYTWMKTSETFYWRYYFVLSDDVYNDIMKSIKKNEISAIEVNVDFDMKERMRVARSLDSAKTIKDLIVIAEKYRARCNTIFDGLQKRKSRIHNFPFQVMLLGFNDLNRTLKKIVNLAT